MISVAHVGTSDKSGGAAISAWRLHDGLKKLGVDSRFVSRMRSSPDPDVSCISSPLFEVLEWHQRFRVIPEQAADATLFSFSPLSVPLLDHPWIARADVVHFHWVAQFISPEDIAAVCKAGKTVFWTFHDQWPYTGGCHYVGGTLRRDEDWSGCSQIGADLHDAANREWLRKKKAFQGLPIQVIAPSQWMAREAAASGVFPACNIHVVPYGIDTSVFRPPSIQSAADGGSNPISLIFGCQYLGERRKGFKELQQSLAICMENSEFSSAVGMGKIVLKTFGAIPDPPFEACIPTTHLGMLGSEQEVAATLGAASAFLCPTLEDNLPNVVLESLACHCPVIGFQTGGLPDMVSHGKNGLLSDKGDVASFAQNIVDFCLNRDLRNHLRQGMEEFKPELHTLEHQASTVLRLYLEKNTPSPTCGNDNACQSPEVGLRAQVLPEYATEIAEVCVKENADRKHWMTVQTSQIASLHEQAEQLRNEIRQITDAHAELQHEKDLLDELYLKNSSACSGYEHDISRLQKEVKRLGNKTALLSARLRARTLQSQERKAKLRVLRTEVKDLKNRTVLQVIASSVRIHLRRVKNRFARGPKDVPIR